MCISGPSVPSLYSLSIPLLLKLFQCARKQLFQVVKLVLEGMLSEDKRIYKASISFGSLPRRNQFIALLDSLSSMLLRGRLRNCLRKVLKLTQALFASKITGLILHEDLYQLLIFPKYQYCFSLNCHLPYALLQSVFRSCLLSCWNIVHLHFN